MQFKKFIVSVQDNGAEEEELNKFLRSHRVLKVDSCFVPNDGYWAFLVNYQEGDPTYASPVSRSNTEKPAPEKELTPEQHLRYQKFVEVRLALSKQERVRAFMVFTNAELIKIAKMEAPTVAQIAAIHGVGTERAAKYGQPLIDALASLTAAEVLPSDASFEELIASDDVEHEAPREFDAARSGY
jgi:superfamily II DNA helicase RecQ